jgi:pyruvate carboxylase
MTDTTMRDGHQSLLATRMRTHDIVKIAGAYARVCRNSSVAGMLGRRDLRRRHAVPDRRSVGAAARSASRAPNLLLQMLLRGANGVGYTNYPDNVVKHFVRQAAAGGIDLFRVFDCLNWVENMRVSMDAVPRRTSSAKRAICYTGDILNSARPKYDLKYYVALAGNWKRPARISWRSRTWPAC